MNILAIEKMLNIALQDKYIFENEAQFRDAFAYELRKTLTDFDVKIEVHFEKKKNGQYSCFDVALKDKSTNAIIPIELKYCKNKFDYKNIIDKTFNISNNFYKRVEGFEQDVKRIKDYLKNEPNAAYGYAILLLYNHNGFPNIDSIYDCVKGRVKDYSYVIKEITQI